MADSVAPQDIDMGAATISRSLELTVSVEHMATSYLRFAFTDDRIHSVVFKNTLVGAPYAAVQALAKINGEWQGPSDWTGNATTTFCQDIAAQHIEELVIIISNSAWETKGKLQPASPPTLTVSTSGCSSVTLSWNADADLDVWILPQSASNLSEVIDQRGQPGFGCVMGLDCSSVEGLRGHRECIAYSSDQTARSEVIQGLNADAHYVAVYLWGPCFRSPPDQSGPDVVPFTITIQYADGRVEQESGEMVDHVTLFSLYGPYDFSPQE